MTLGNLRNRTTRQINCKLNESKTIIVVVIKCPQRFFRSRTTCSENDDDLYESTPTHQSMERINSSFQHYILAKCRAINIKQTKTVNNKKCSHTRAPSVKNILESIPCSKTFILNVFLTQVFTSSTGFRHFAISKH